MNTYNENLHASVVNSLRGLELDQKKVKSKLNSAKVTLYYDQGAKVTAADRLEIAQKNLEAKDIVKKEAVVNNNIATNVLAAADQEKKLVDLSVNNIAVGAANVQIASDAIVRLASDMGSILSIVKAESKNTDLYEHAKKAYYFINTTAYNAELASQHTMEASAKTAEVSSTKVAEKAKTTHEGVNTVLKVASAEFDDAIASVNTNNGKLADASTAEKVAEGTVEDINVEDVATDAAYFKSNLELNMNLRIDEKDISSSGYTVRFNYLKTPFWMVDNGDEGNSSKGTPSPVPVDYPVTQYNIFLVSEKKKFIFSLSDAENLLKKGASPNDTSNTQKKTYFVSYAPEPNKTSAEIPLTFQSLVDSDGNEMKHGEPYVIFVMAVYNIDYKNKLNNYSDYLSAASAPFRLRFKLKSPDVSTFKFIPGETKNITKSDETEIIRLFDKHGEKVKEVDFIKEVVLQTKKTILPKWTFGIDASTRNTSDVEYRCMFLPADPEIVNGLLTADGLRNIERDEEHLANIGEKYDPLIEAANKALNLAKSQLQQFNDELGVLKQEQSDLKTQLSAAETEKDKKSIKENQAKNTKAIPAKNIQITKQVSTVKEAQTKLDKLENERKEAVEAIKLSPVEKAGIFFDLKIAENVTAANYVPAYPLIAEDKETTNSGDETDSETSTDPGITTKYFIDVAPEVTDNFGNPLIDGNHYVPVVLTISKQPEIFQNQYLNIISDYKNTDAFPYQEVK